MKINSDSLTNLPIIRKNVFRKRVSSYDKSGGNLDFNLIKPKEKKIICKIEGIGCIKHVWMTLSSEDKYHLRKVVIRMWWDNEKNPSVECPIGDFFGVGHGKSVNFWSLPLSMSPENGKGFNCWFAMPFSERATIEVENETEVNLMCYYYVDYEQYSILNSEFENYSRFHAYWNRENPCKGRDYKKKNKIELWSKKNLDHKDDYLILEAEGEGHYVGCHLDIHNLLEIEGENWPGEGDDYIEIDDSSTILYGTGTEDYFCTAWGPSQFYCSPYFGVTLPGGINFSGKISYYRFHIEDPIVFHKNIKIKIEHGHANQRSDDWSSTAYWYQLEPHKKFNPIRPYTERLPREEPNEKY